MNVFITGGTSGIGLGLCRYYLAIGCHVAITGRKTSPIQNSDLGKNPNLIIYQVDVTDSQKMGSVISKFYEQVGSLDIVIANAGRSIASKSSWPDTKVGIEVIQTNVLGVIYTFSPALEVMKKQKSGQLVVISSVAGLVGLPGASFYSASKACVLTLCESLSIDLKEFGISVTCICPGFIDTPLTQKNGHHMPFLMGVDKASEKIARAIQARKELFIFPWQMNILISFLHYMPRWLYRYIMGVRLFDYRSRERSS